MAHLGARAFDTIGGEVVSTTSFIIKKLRDANYKGSYLRLIDGRNEKDKAKMLLEAINNRDCGWFFTATSSDFKKIPGSPIAYWVSDKVREVFKNNKKLGDVVKDETDSVSKERILTIKLEDGEEFKISSTFVN